jgi:hypothetical protein
VVGIFQLLQNLAGFGLNGEPEQEELLEALLHSLH